MTVSLSEQLNSQDGDELPCDLDLPDISYSPDHLIEKAETEKNILNGINALPESLRETMILRHVKDMPYEQIASVLDCKVGTVKSRIARGRELLREYLIGLDGGESSGSVSQNAQQ